MVKPYGLYQFNVMPLGLCMECTGNVTAADGTGVGKIALVWYILMIELRLAVLLIGIERCLYAGLKIKPSKCNMLQTNVHYLGHVVSTR